MMTDIVFKSGKLPAQYRKSDYRLTDFVNTRTLPTPPSIFGHGNTFKDWGFLGNDRYGCCVFAGSAHETMDFANLGAGGQTGVPAVIFSEESVLSDYSAVTGFNRNDPNTDKGTDVGQAMEYRLKTGILDANGNRHKIAAYVALEPGNILQHIQATYLFDAVGIGIEFPESAMDQFNRNQIWSVVPGAKIEGGHYIPLVGRPEIGQLACLTWGRRQVLTEEFLTKYCDEAYGILSQETINKVTGKSYEGFEFSQLEEYLATFKK